MQASQSDPTCSPRRVVIAGETGQMKDSTKVQRRRSGSEKGVDQSVTKLASASGGSLPQIPVPRVSFEKLERAVSDVMMEREMEEIENSPKGTTESPLVPTSPRKFSSVQEKVEQIRLEHLLAAEQGRPGFTSSNATAKGRPRSGSARGNVQGVVKKPPRPLIKAKSHEGLPGVEKVEILSKSASTSRVPVRRQKRTVYISPMFTVLRADIERQEKEKGNEKGISEQEGSPLKEKGIQIRQEKKNKSINQFEQVSNKKEIKSFNSNLYERIKKKFPKQKQGDVKISQRMIEEATNFVRSKVDADAPLLKMVQNEKEKRRKHIPTEVSARQYHADLVPRTKEIYQKIQYNGKLWKLITHKIESLRELIINFIKSEKKFSPFANQYLNYIDEILIASAPKPCPKPLSLLENEDPMTPLSQLIKKLEEIEKKNTPHKKHLSSKEKELLLFNEQICKILEKYVLGESLTSIIGKLKQAASLERYTDPTSPLFDIDGMRRRNLAAAAIVNQRHPWTESTKKPIPWHQISIIEVKNTWVRGTSFLPKLWINNRQIRIYDRLFNDPTYLNLIQERIKGPVFFESVSQPSAKGSTERSVAFAKCLLNGDFGEIHKLYEPTDNKSVLLTDWIQEILENSSFQNNFIFCGKGETGKNLRKNMKSLSSEEKLNIFLAFAAIPSHELLGLVKAQENKQAGDKEKMKEKESEGSQPDKNVEEVYYNREEMIENYIKDALLAISVRINSEELDLLNEELSSLSDDEDRTHRWKKILETTLNDKGYEIKLKERAIESLLVDYENIATETGKNKLIGDFILKILEKNGYLKIKKEVNYHKKIIKNIHNNLREVLNSTVSVHQFEPFVFYHLLKAIKENGFDERMKEEEIPYYVDCIVNEKEPLSPRFTDPIPDEELHERVRKRIVLQRIWTLLRICSSNFLGNANAFAEATFPQIWTYPFYALPNNEGSYKCRLVFETAGRFTSKTYRTYTIFQKLEEDPKSCKVNRNVPAKGQFTLGWEGKEPIIPEFLFLPKLERRKGEKGAFALDLNEVIANKEESPGLPTVKACLSVQKLEIFSDEDKNEKWAIWNAFIDYVNLEEDKRDQFNYANSPRNQSQTVTKKGSQIRK